MKQNPGEIKYSPPVLSRNKNEKRNNMLMKELNDPPSIPYFSKLINLISLHLYY